MLTALSPRRNTGVQQGGAYREENVFVILAMEYSSFFWKTVTFLYIVTIIMAGLFFVSVCCMRAHLDKRRARYCIGIIVFVSISGFL